MDDLTKKHLDEMEARLSEEVTLVRGEMNRMEDRLRKEMNEIGDGLREKVANLGEHLDEQHREQMRKFQAVIDEAERIGAHKATSTRFAELEASVAQLRKDVDALKGPGAH